VNDEPTEGDVAAEAALRQLRRRYDDLRADYEALLRRIAELEERAAGAEEAVPATPSFGIFEQLLAPLVSLRDEYLDALEGLQRLVGGIDDLLPGRLKAQRPSAGVSSSRIQVDVRGRGPRELLEFRERIAALEGVAAVSIHAIDPERAVLVVELA
jgi:hypothetical protein